MSVDSPSDDPVVHWSVSVFQVSTARIQQRVLRALRHTDPAGVMVLAARSGNHHFVIVDSERLVDEVRSQRIIMAVDRHARRTYSSRDHRAQPVPARHLASVPSLATSRASR